MSGKKLCHQSKQNAARRVKIFLGMPRGTYLIYLYCENGQDASSCNILWNNSMSQQVTYLLLPLYSVTALLENFSTEVFFSPVLQFC